MVGGSVDRIAVGVVALCIYVWLPGDYSKEAPLRSFNFTIPLPKSRVERLLVHDFQETATLWLKEVEAVEKYKGSHAYFLRSSPHDMVVRWHKTAKDTWQQSHKVSPLFIRKREDRPSPATIEASPGLDWAVEWKLVALSAAETAVQRTIFKFEQVSNRWLPLHRLVPLACAEEHVLMSASFPRVAAR